MATSRDFVYDEQGEMLPSDSAAAAARRKELDDDARMVSDAKDAAKAPAPSAKMPTRPGQGAKPKSGIVTKEELEKSGLSLRDYMNKQRGLTRRDGAAPKPSVSKAPVKPKTSSTKPKTSTPAVSSSYRSEGAGKTKPADKPPAPAAATKKPKEPNIVKFAKGLRARGEADLEARGLSTSEKAKPPAQKPEPTAASYSNEGRGRPAAATKKPEPFEMPITRVLRAIRERGDADLKSRGMAKGGSVSSASKRADGIAQRGKTRGKVY
jgi:hypothetical protein